MLNKIIFRKNNFNNSKSILSEKSNGLSFIKSFFFSTNYFNNFNSMEKIFKQNKINFNCKTFPSIINRANLFNFQKKNFTVIVIGEDSQQIYSPNSYVQNIRSVASLNMTNISDNPRARIQKRRVGRGPGSSKGKTSARGHKIRGEPYRHFEGGQTNIFRRLPKHGFRTKIFKDEHSYINIKKILYLIHKGRINPAEPIGVKQIFYAGGVTKVVDGIKLLSRGMELLKDFPPLHISVQSASEKAIKAIKEAGGSVTILHGTRNYNKFIIKPAKFTRPIKEPYPSFKRVRKMLRLKEKGALYKFIYLKVF